jgi:hypothetical protein
MKTSEFIKMLQEADPTGEAHIRMEGGVPYSAILKEGYYDGPYSYIDEDFNYVYSASGSKLDLYCLDVWGYVDRIKGKAETFDEIKHKFKFDLGIYINPENRQSREYGILKEAEDAFNEMKGIESNLYQKELEDSIKKSELGWRWFQNKDVDNVPEGEMNMHVYYTWKIMGEDGKLQPYGSNVWQTEPVLKSGLWEKTDNGEMDGYYEWIKK